MRAWLGQLMGGSIAAALLPCALLAQTAPPQVPIETAPPDKDIVVQGERPSMSEVQKQAKSITQIDDIFTEAMARFQEPVCPGIIGMPHDYATWMVDRIRAVVTHAGMRVGKDGCHANLIVAFVIDGHAEVNHLMQTRGYLFSEMKTEETKELQEDTGPVHAWLFTHVRTRDGMGSIGSTGNGNVPVFTMSNAASRILLASRIDIGASVVVINLAAIDGMSLNQIADYAAMRGLVRTKPPKGPTATGTILTLFNPDGPRPDGLTPFDIAYIKAAYSSHDSLPAYAKVSKAARETVREQSADKH
jgi:hypothetical protein